MIFGWATFWLLRRSLRQTVLGRFSPFPGTAPHLLRQIMWHENTVTYEA
jgi:hypothetical protein